MLVADLQSRQLGKYHSLLKGALASMYVEPLAFSTPSFRLRYLVALFVRATSSCRSSDGLLKNFSLQHAAGNSLAFQNPSEEPAIASRLLYVRYFH